MGEKLLLCLGDARPHILYVKDKGGRRHVSNQHTPHPIAIPCRDGFRLAGHLWQAQTQISKGLAIINPATGVAAKYYHYYARFLAEQGFDALTYDYRGIGLSRPQRLRGSGIRWRDWGTHDFDAAVAWARARDPKGYLAVVGHSIGGFLPGFAPSARLVDRYFTVGAQYAFWPDYAKHVRLPYFVKWHVAMPLMTAALGYFPGKRLGWLEDLPAGVAHEWSFRGARMEDSYPRHERAEILENFAAVRAPILAVAMSDDEFATPAAVLRGLGYYKGSERLYHQLKPTDLGFAKVGHFDLFHARHREGFWQMSLSWLKDGVNPWPEAKRLP